MSKAVATNIAPRDLGSAALETLFNKVKYCVYGAPRPWTRWPGRRNAGPFLGCQSSEFSLFSSEISVFSSEFYLFCSEFLFFCSDSNSFYFPCLAQSFPCLAQNFLCLAQKFPCSAQDLRITPSFFKDTPSLLGTNLSKTRRNLSYKPIKNLILTLQKKTSLGSFSEKWDRISENQYRFSEKQGCDFPNFGWKPIGTAPTGWKPIVHTSSGLRNPAAGQTNRIGTRSVQMVRYQ